MLKISLILPLSLILIAASLLTGAGSVSLSSLMAGSSDNAGLILLASRLPRTLALILAGGSLAIAGTIMQMLTQNRFVEPSTAGTTESAALGMLTAMLIFPDMPVIGKMVFAALFAMAGTALFLKLVRHIPARSVLMVPLTGIMLAGVIGAVTSFLAYRFDMLQSLGAWSNGDFSMVLRGRYEILWIGLALAILAYLTAARFTLAGLGEAVAVSAGLNYRRAMLTGLAIVALTSASVVVTVGTIPFVGLIVPNVVSLIFGDNLRKTLPIIAFGGAALVLACDILGRILIMPYEIPVGTMMGIIGSMTFLYLLLRRDAHAS
ncbi:iron chelate uptake ABC transporter family permease subunit [Martelella alba]|uniref:Iron chelate uptake ABC transporter family permease subunit n=1 Tax=Martelella alba TaxID=2590451 RepID=A0A506U8D7_9HYPH|nr:iron chelate uptake ABC transporter family permease subunit [Martelella alba]TPW28819.1 iron chelate uptake ABC transporter family permease subunit [Martelella alba]